jgi:hypothetical protein
MRARLVNLQRMADCIMLEIGSWVVGVVSTPSAIEFLAPVVKFQEKNLSY